MDKENKIKTGDVVKLKSGGATMTVGDIDGEDVTCTWFTQSGKCKMWKFKESQLEITEKIPYRF